MILDIGSGPHPKIDADIRMDINDFPGVNCKHDLLIIPYPFNNDTFDKIYMGDILEHIFIFDLDKVLDQVYRILKKDGILEITVPDARWIFERVINGDWKTQANVQWLNQYETDWENAMSYLFGGFHNKNEYKMRGMGHVNAFDEERLISLLKKHGFVNCNRVEDYRNPIPARNSILKIVCEK